MIGILSLYTKHNESCGFNTVEDMKNSLHYSSLLAKKHSNKLYLFTDKKGEEIISDFKSIYDEIIVCLDDLDWVHDYNWAFSKIYSYTFMKEPFFHIDMDAYLIDGFPDTFKSCDLFFQSKENFKDYKFYENAIDEVKSILPTNILNSGTNYALNCGLIGFNDISIIDEYYNLSLDYIKKNQNYNWNKQDHKYHQCILFEQYFISCLSKNKKIETLLNDDYTKKYDLRYTHLIVNAKRNQSHMSQIKRRLNNLITAV